MIRPFANFARAAILGAAIAFVAPSGLARATPVDSVRVTESDGLVIPFRRDVASVVVADPGIADVQLLSDRSIFLFGKAVGATKLYVLDSDDDIIVEQRIFVTRSLQRLQETARAVPATVPVE